MMKGMAVDDQAQTAILGRVLRSSPPVPVDGLDDEMLGDLIAAGLLVRHDVTVTATAAATTFYELAREFPGPLPT